MVVEYIDLSQNKVDQPFQGRCVREMHFTVASCSPDTRFLVVDGLVSCKAIAFYNPTDKRGLIGHVSYTRSVEWSVQRLIQNFGEGFPESTCFVACGNHQADDPHWPTLDSLAQEIGGNNPKRLVLYPNIGTMPSGFRLDLETGKFEELNLKHEFEDAHGLSQWEKRIEIWDG